MRALVAAACVVFATLVAADTRPRAREIGIAPGVYQPGPLDAITDVPDVRVGQVTLVEGDRVRTGVTAILPHGGNLFQDKVAGAVFVGNAFGKLAGSTQVNELGTIETPVVLTNTLSVGTAMDAIVRDTLAQPGNENVRSVNALVGETNDGTLNDIRGLHVTTAHVMSAIEAARRSASGSKVEEGAVGAGTGTICYGWKGGIGTASRVLPANAGGYVLGVIVQTNFGGNLTIDGIPIWKLIGKAASAASKATNADGSCMIVIATNAPLTSRDLQRVAARGVFGLARTGSSYSHGSGDFAIAFSTSAEVRVRAGDTTPRAHTLLPSEAISPLFEAALEATEEAVYNSLFRATTTTANGRTIEALPIDRVKALINPTASRPR